ncbi:hypothetical protein D3C76_1354070 [compost metagenome]
MMRALLAKANIIAFLASLRPYDSFNKSTIKKVNGYKKTPGVTIISNRSQYTSFVAAIFVKMYKANSSMFRTT